MVYYVKRANSPFRCIGINKQALMLLSKCNWSITLLEVREKRNLQICFQNDNKKKHFPKLLHTNGKLMPKLWVGANKFGVGAHRFRVRLSFE